MNIKIKLDKENSQKVFQKLYDEGRRFNNSYTIRYVLDTPIDGYAYMFTANNNSKYAGWSGDYINDKYYKDQTHEYNYYTTAFSFEKEITAAEFLEIDEVKEETKQYMVSCDGKEAPKKVHSTYESALKEAERLVQQQPNKIVRILELKSVLKSQIIFTKEDL